MGRACPLSRDAARGQVAMYLYILQSCKDGGCYVGISADPNKRLLDHNAGRCSATKPRRPLKLLYQEEWPDTKSARQREKYLKSYAGSREKQKIIEQF